MALLLFGVCSHLFVATLELKVKKGNITRLSFLERDQLLIKVFAKESLLFLKVETEILKSSLQQVIQTFAFVGQDLGATLRILD